MLNSEACIVSIISKNKDSLIQCVSTQMNKVFNAQLLQ